MMHGSPEVYLSPSDVNMPAHSEIRSHQEHTKNDTVQHESSAANAGTLYLVLIQVASRALTFAGNQFLLRYLSPTLLGLAVQLELVSVTVLYTSRESLRVALQRQPAIKERIFQPKRPNQSHNEARTSSQQAVNLAYLVLLVGLCASYVFGHGYLRHSGHEVLQSTDFWLAFKLYALATFVELLSEPAFVVIQQHSLYKARARAETGAAIVRCIFACLTAIIMHLRQTPPSVLPFAVGQLAYAGTIFTAYLAAVLPVANINHFSLLPHRIQEAQTPGPSNYWLGLFFAPLLTLTTTFYAQSVFKLLLTQGDSFILSLIADLRSQGAFALASNYGGLLSRLLFQPVEESSRNVFGRLLAPNDRDKDAQIGVSQPQTSKHETSDRDREIPLDNTSTVSAGRRTNTALALSHLTTTLHLYNLFALPILSLLPHLLPPLIATLVGPRWSNPATFRLLSAYAYYLPFLALNGVLDAFVTSVASPRQLRTQSLIMFIITILYGALAWMLISPPNMIKSQFASFGYSYYGIGPSGLVYANIANMAMRISYSVWFMRHWIKTNVSDANEWANVVKRSLPNMACVLTSLIVAIGLGVMVGPNDDISKSFLGVRGLDVNDIGYLVGGIVVLGSSILAFEYQFLISMVLGVLPKRLRDKILPYLPKQKTN